MANNINRLAFNITGYNYARQEETAYQNVPEQKEKAPAKEKSKIGANDVLSFMAASNADMVPVKQQRTVDVNQYVTSEQADRIAGFMKGFEADFNEAAQTAIDEFGVNEKTADEIALAYMNTSL